MAAKSLWKNGAAFSVLDEEIRSTIAKARDTESLEGFGADLDAALARVKDVTEILISARSDNLRLALADATLYLDTVGHMVVAWVWLKQALVATAAEPNAVGQDAAFYAGKWRPVSSFPPGIAEGPFSKPICWNALTIRVSDTTRSIVGLRIRRRQLCERHLTLREGIMFVALRISMIAISFPQLELLLGSGFPMAILAALGLIKTGSGVLRH